MTSTWDPVTGYSRLTLRATLLMYLFLTLLPMTLPFLETGWNTASAGLVPAPAIRLLSRSLHLSFWAACIAICLGLPAGIGLWHAKSIVFRLRSLVLLTLLLPPYLLIQGWMSLAWSPPPGLAFLRTPEGFSWAAIILGTSMAPLAAILIGLGRYFLPLSALESMALSQGPTTTYRKLIVPLLLPLLVSSWLIIAMLSLLEGGVPLSLQFPVFATEVTSRFLGGENPVSLAQNVWPLYLASALLGISAIIVTHRLSRRNESNVADLNHSLLNISCLPKKLQIIIRSGWLLLALLIALPLLGMVRQAFAGSAYNLTLVSDGAALLRSLALAAVTAASATLIVVPAAACIALKRHFWLALITFLPLALPASITGITWAAWGARLHALCRWLPETMPLLLSHLGRVLPFTMLVSLALWNSHHRQSAREAVFMHRNHLWQRISVEWPHYLLVFMVGAVFSLRELEISLLTVPPGGETLPIRVFNLLHYGAGSDVARLSLLLALPIVVATLLIVKKWENA
ncbi:MAG: hypothetical protein A2W80_02380 [Candidatus Riflebacteria bacterium GWC2_50_8]|nr:MAG: hypothetical protein A2W80_02380 [Candidatus Riflebacteria bacterium GWC2_50_8]